MVHPLATALRAAEVADADLKALLKTVPDIETARPVWEARQRAWARYDEVRIADNPAPTVAR